MGLNNLNGFFAGAFPLYWNPYFTIRIALYFRIHLCEGKRGPVDQFVVGRRQPFGINPGHGLL